MEELANRILGFMPPKSIFWSALATMLFAFALQKAYSWFKNIAQLPWMKAENQAIREKILQESRKKD